MKFDSQVVRHASWEMALMRAAFALTVWSSVPFFYYQTTLSHPNGLAHFVNLGFLMNPEILGIFRGLLAVALLFYVIGLRPAVRWRTPRGQSTTLSSRLAWLRWRSGSFQATGQSAGACSAAFRSSRWPAWILSGGSRTPRKSLWFPAM